MARPIIPKFQVHDRVEDVDSKRVGSIVHVYSEPELEGVLVAVRFNDDETPLAVHVLDIRKVRS